MIYKRGFRSQGPFLIAQMDASSLPSGQLLYGQDELDVYVTSVSKMVLTFHMWRSLYTRILLAGIDLKRNTASPRMPFKHTLVISIDSASARDSL